ncbi:glycosyltransferase [Roseomonas haemaphysalidis]|uniref:Glycosyltransferase n=1 Tax=Roseomonas haemaphysalidis TaxID=2768162 RepID=A0ABS3KUL6_9PROT|nr:glycosyltransferase [Roseomonas haemaphysalidis]MBO1081161.1 glycosyltransferase [Roseomonas haemaphysalidis]
MTPLPCVVCVPAKDEAAAVPRLLRALAAQRAAGPDRPLRVLLLANNCTDATAAVARASAHPALDLRVQEARLLGDEAHVGFARRQALALGLDWLRRDGEPEGALISTDADALPPPDWIGAQLRALAEGADCVGGRIDLDDSLPLPPGLLAVRDTVARYWAAVRALADRIDPLPWDPAPRHGDHVAGSLAIAAPFYEAIGGLPPLPCGEDNALVAEVERAGGRLRHDPAVFVRVSAREDGRASGGMATEMVKWRRIAETGAPHLLSDAAFWQALLQRRADLRALFHARRLEGKLAALAAGCPNDIAFLARAEPLLPALPQAEAPIATATAALEALARDGRIAA